MSGRIYIEGGGAKELDVRCRAAFRSLFEHCGFGGRMPRLVASGPRERAYDDFTTGLRNTDQGGFVGLLVDSETPMADFELTWSHLGQSDGWTRPPNARNEQVLLMVTCMETWIVADQSALRKCYGPQLQVAALPGLADLEQRSPHEIFSA